MLDQILPSIRATLVLALYTGVVFPLAITGMAQVLFPDQANGSLIKSSDGQVIGSSLIGQTFTSPLYFHPRPSGAGKGYDGVASAGTNLGPTSKKLIEGGADDPQTTDVDESYPGIKQLTQIYRHDNGLERRDLVPVDAVTRSGSGLDPDISETNALLQAARVGRERSLSFNEVVDLIHNNERQRDLGFLGEKRVNVLLLNLALNKLQSSK